MTDHLSVTTKDLRRLLDLTDPAKVDEPGSPLPWSLLTGLMNLVGCDGVTYESHDVANKAVLHHQSTSRLDGGDFFADDAVQNSFWSLYWRGLCDYWPRTGDYTSARRMLADPNWPLWRGTAYVEWVQSFGVHGEITVALPPDGGLHHRLLFWRFSGRDFTERDCLLLTLIQPRIASLHAAIRRRQVGAVDLTPRQWELMRLIAAGNTNRQIASRLVLSEGTVRTHCENIFQRLQVTNRLAAVARAFPTGTASVLTTPRQESDGVIDPKRASGSLGKRHTGAGPVDPPTELALGRDRRRTGRASSLLARSGSSANLELRLSRRSFDRS